MNHNWPQIINDIRAKGYSDGRIARAIDYVDKRLYEIRKGQTYANGLKKIPKPECREKLLALHAQTRSMQNIPIKRGQGKNQERHSKKTAITMIHCINGWQCD